LAKGAISAATNKTFTMFGKNPFAYFSRKTAVCCKQCQFAALLSTHSRTLGTRERVPRSTESRLNRNY